MTPTPTEPISLPPLLDAYITCALWSSLDDAGQPLDADATVADLHPTTLAQMRADCLDFLRNHEDTIGADTEQAGHDLWLTRNGHGTGFWAGHWPEPDATLLTADAHELGPVTLLRGDDGLLHASHG